MSDGRGPLGEVQLAALTLYASDLDGALSWYSEKLGLEPMMVGRDGDRYASFLVGGSILVLEPIEAALGVQPAARAEQSATVNLVVERDADEVRDELLSRGVECGEVVTSPGYASFLMKDPYGNRFYVAQPRNTQAQQEAGAVSQSLRGAGAGVGEDRDSR